MVIARSLLGQSVRLAGPDGGVQVYGQGRVAGSGPGLPCPGQQLAAHAVELTDVAPATKLRRKVPRVDGALTAATENTGRPTGTQRIGVVDAVAAS